MMSKGIEVKYVASEIWKASCEIYKMLAMATT